MIVELFGELLLLLQWVGGDVASTLISFRFARCYRIVGVMVMMMIIMPLMTKEKETEMKKETENNNNKSEKEEKDKEEDGNGDGNRVTKEKNNCLLIALLIALLLIVRCWSE